MEKKANEQGADLFVQQLVKAGFLTENQVKIAAEGAAKEKKPIVLYLAEKKIIEAHVIAKRVSECFETPLYDLAVHDINLIPKEFLELDIVKNKVALPILKKGNQLVIAAIFLNLPEFRDLGFTTGTDINYVIVESDKLKQMIAKVRGDKLGANPKKKEAGLQASVFSGGASLGLKESMENYDPNVTPVVGFLNKVITDAIDSKSSDIHFEPYEKRFRVRYRQDGILYEVAEPPIGIASTVVARLKVMANLDISEHRLPQDGRFKMALKKGRPIDFRISTCPTMYGEKVVLRILDPTMASLDVGDLGMDETQQELFYTAVKQPQGMLLVTGPTGSGKTVTLYSALRLLNTTERNISTIEDPIEIYMEGVNQVQVNIKTGMTFSVALRAFLRQDPDVMMVGEVRDVETSDISIKAAQTGHLVLSTLHTNSAALTIARLGNMGVKAFDIVSSVTLVIAQRLVRKLCPHCKQEIKDTAVEFTKLGALMSEIPDMKIYRPGSCDRCVDGYKGRIGIFEVMPMTEEMAKVIMREGTAVEIAEQAYKEGVISIAEAGLNKVKAGLTSLQEINRVVEL